MITKPFNIWITLQNIPVSVLKLFWVKGMVKMLQVYPFSNFLFRNFHGISRISRAAHFLVLPSGRRKWRHLPGLGSPCLCSSSLCRPNYGASTNTQGLRDQGLHGESGSSQHRHQVQLFTSDKYLKCPVCHFPANFLRLYMLSPYESTIVLLSFG